MAVKVKSDPRAAASEAVSMVLMGILTFLVILLSYKWFRSRLGGGRMVRTDNRTAQDKTQGKGDTSKTKATKTDSATKKEEDDDEDSTNIDDVLVKASDIKPLDAETLQRLGSGDQPQPETIEDAHRQHKKAQELEEEVARNLSQEQLEEEAKVRQNQLAAIFKLMEENKERFGVDSMNDVQEQYKLYK